MSVNLQMNQYGMCVSVKLTNSDEYEVNNTGLLKLLDDFLHRVEIYENVDIEIKKTPVPVTWPFEQHDDTITVTSSGSGDMSFSIMNDTIKA